MPKLDELELATILAALRYWRDLDATDGAPAEPFYLYTDESLGTLRHDEIGELIAKFDA